MNYSVIPSEATESPNLFNNNRLLRHYIPRNDCSINIQSIFRIDIINSTLHFSLLGGLLYRFNNLFISGTAAEISGNRFLDFFIRWIRNLIQ